MDKITHEVRLAQWRQIIGQCQARPKGQTAKQWLAEKGISTKQYYYWLRKVRQYTYDEATESGLIHQAQVNAVPVASEVKNQPITFAELPFPVEESNELKAAFQPTAVVKTRNTSVAFSNAASPELLSALMKEVLGHA